MRRTYAWRDGQLVELTETPPERITEVMNDTGEFVATSGVRITSRSGWREHLKRTGSTELGASDISYQQSQWGKRKEKFKERLNRPGIREVDPPSEEIRAPERTRISAEVMNRLDGRPTPDRKTLIKLTLETARELQRKR